MDSLTIIFILNGVFFISFFLLKNIYIPLGLSLLTLFILLLISKQKKIPSIQSSFNLPSLNLNNNRYITVIVCLIIFIVLEKIIGFNAALFAGFFIFAYQNKLDSRASFFIALIFLVITALFSMGGRSRVAEDVAIMVYYFLIIGVVWQIIELLKEKTEKEMIPINFLSKKNIIIAGAFIFLIFIIALYFTYSKFQVKKSAMITPINTVSVALTPTPFKHVPFTILNGTDIRGLASSSATTLRKAGWDNEFDITIGNYEGTISANLLRYTKSLSGKISPLERDLNIRITPFVLKDATREAEMTLILGE